jgi:hypothetical protein
VVADDVASLEALTRKLLNAVRKARRSGRVSSHGYTVAPVTVDSDYLRYMEQIFTFFEDVSRRVTGREVAQILLLHANALNADRFDALAAALKRRGYRFVTVAQALEDPVYRLRDEFVAYPTGAGVDRHLSIGHFRRTRP